MYNIYLHNYVIDIVSGKSPTSSSESEDSDSDEIPSLAHMMKNRLERDEYIQVIIILLTYI